LDNTKIFHEIIIKNLTLIRIENYNIKGFVVTNMIIKDCKNITTRDTDRVSSLHIIKSDVNLNYNIGYLKISDMKVNLYRFKKYSIISLEGCDVFSSKPVYIKRLDLDTHCTFNLKNVQGDNIVIKNNHIIILDKIKFNHITVSDADKVSVKKHAECKILSINDCKYVSFNYRLICTERLDIYSGQKNTTTFMNDCFYLDYSFKRIILKNSFMSRINVIKI
jgi:hypothetical protein